MAKDQYNYGRKKEHKVAQSLRKKGASVTVSKGSKGAADLIAKFPSGKEWHIQVKSTRSGQAASPSKKDTGRLKQVATKRHATPVVAKVSPDGISYESARTGRELSHSSKKSTAEKKSTTRSKKR